MKPDDIPQDVWVSASYLHMQIAERERSVQLNHVDGVTLIARAILSATKAADAASADIARQHADRYMNDAGWFRDANGEWQRPAKTSTDMETHNAFISRANAASAIEAAIRQRSEKQ